MKQSEFSALVEGLQVTESDLQQAKCRDYAEAEGDVLSNFKEAAEFVGITPLQACLVYIYKHLCAIRAYALGHTKQTDDIRTRILDLRLYFALFLALAQEEELDDMEWAEGL